MKKNWFILFLLAFTQSSAQYISTFAGIKPADSPDSCGFHGDNGLAKSALFQQPTSICRDHSGNLYICDYTNHRIRMISATTGKITTVVGGGEIVSNNVPATSDSIGTPWGICLDKAGNLYVTSEKPDYVYKINMTTGILTRIAGTGNEAYNGDNIPATSASLYIPADVCVDTAGNIYLADGSNRRVRKIDASTGIITTFAGRGIMGNSGDGGPATDAELSAAGVMLDAGGNLYITDWGNKCIRKVDALTGIISTIAGTGAIGSSGDGGPATAAELNQPYRTIMDNTGNLYISDQGNTRIRKINTSTSIITTVAGGHPKLDITLGDNNLADSAYIWPFGMCFDTCGDLFIVDQAHCRIRVVTPSLPAQLCDFPNGVPIAEASENKMDVYPNPNRGAFNVHIYSATNEPATVVVTNVLGQKVMELTTSTNRATEMQIKRPGIYFINARTESGHWVERVVVE